MEPKVSSRAQKSPPLVPVLGQINPAHIIASKFSYILILSSTYIKTFLAVFVVLPFPSKSPMHSWPLHAQYMPYPPHPTCCLIWQRAQIKEFPHYDIFSISYYPLLSLSLSALHILNTQCEAIPVLNYLSTTP
jgi:hypothetical protein